MERFEQIIKAANNKYDQGAPVQIIASALLRDNMTYKYLLQVKMKNTSKFTLKHVRVVIVLFNDEGNKLGNEITYDYELEKVFSDSEFGSKEAIALPDVTDIKSYKITVESVAFTNNLNWIIGQDIEDVYNHQIQEIVKDIKVSLNDNLYRKSFELLKDIPDDYEGKDDVEKMIYDRCLYDAKQKLNEGDPDSAKNILNMVPDTVDGKASLITLYPASYLKAAEKSINLGDYNTAEIYLSNVPPFQDGKEIVESHLNESKSNDLAIENKKKKKKYIIVGIIATVVVCFLLSTVMSSMGKKEIEFYNRSFTIPDVYEVSNESDKSVTYMASIDGAATTLTFFEQDYFESMETFIANKDSILKAVVNGMSSDLVMDDNGNFSGNFRGYDAQGRLDAIYDEDDSEVYLVCILETTPISKSYISTIGSIVKSSKRID